MSAEEVSWRVQRALGYLGEARRAADDLPLSARTAAYYAAFHACHVALLSDPRFFSPEVLSSIHPELREEHRQPMKHRGKPDQAGNVGLAWVLPKTHPQLSGHLDYLRVISERVRYERLTMEEPIATPAECIARAELVLKRAGVTN